MKLPDDNMLHLRATWKYQHLHNHSTQACGSSASRVIVQSFAQKLANCNLDTKLEVFLKIAKFLELFKRHKLKIRSSEKT